MSGLISLLTSAATGSFIGAVGSYFTKKEENKAELKKADIDLRKDLAQYEHEEKMVSLQLSAQRDIATLDADTKKFEADMAALKTSLEMDKATYATVDTSKANKWLVFVDFCRGMMRPIITGGLATYCTAVTAYSLYEYGEVFDKNLMAAQVFALIDAMTVYTGVAITWWFGSRGHKKEGKR